MTRDDLQSKLDVIRDNLEKLDRIPQAAETEFLSDFRNVDSALYRLQTTLQALIDISALVVARNGLAVSTSSRGVLEGLESAGRLPAGSAARFGPLVGFRNRIVHLYDRVDPRIVYRILREDRPDLEELLRLLLAGLPPRA